MILGEMAVWHMDFTSDKVLLSHAIDELYTMGKFKSFDSTSLFKETLEHADLDQDDGSTIRLILVYTRSDIVPSEPDPEVQEVLAASGRFFYDCVYIHQKAGEVTGPIKPQHVYDRLTEMEDARSPGYYYELTRLLKKYCTAMGELLAHPSIRPVQDRMCYKMQPPPIRRIDEAPQQQQQPHVRQQHTTSHLRKDLAVTYRSSDNLIGGAGMIPSQNMGNFFSPPSAPPRPTRTTSSGQITTLNMSSAHPTSPFASPNERSNPPRGVKTELSQSGPPSRQDSFAGSGNGTSQSSGSGAAMDDAILI
ncbi:hypothetical protein BGZ76_001379 [Entomortierella beljakovae]|nr:hypothetical protein BGZ76_001379 [Entomortierella beljakovae]